MPQVTSEGSMQSMLVEETVGSANEDPQHNASVKLGSWSPRLSGLVVSPLSDVDFGLPTAGPSHSQKLAMPQTAADSHCYDGLSGIVMESLNSEL